MEGAGIRDTAGWCVTTDPLEKAWVNGVPLWSAKFCAWAGLIESATFPTAKEPRGVCSNPLEPDGSGGMGATEPEEGARGPSGE